MKGGDGLGGERCISISIPPPSPIQYTRGKHGIKLSPPGDRVRIAANCRYCSVGRFGTSCYAVIAMVGWQNGSSPRLVGYKKLPNPLRRKPPLHHSSVAHTPRPSSQWQTSSKACSTRSRCVVVEEHPGLSQVNPPVAELISRDSSSPSLPSSSPSSPSSIRSSMGSSRSSGAYSRASLDLSGLRPTLCSVSLSGSCLEERLILTANFVVLGILAVGFIVYQNSKKSGTASNNLKKKAQ